MLTREEWLSKAGEWYTPEPNSGCWLWLGQVRGSGYHRGVVYGRVSVGGRRYAAAHRVSYELLRGPIPAGLTIDHLCRTPLCVNPDHMEPVSNAENVRRGVGRTATNARKTECKRGHPLEGENLILYATGARNCRACKNLRQNSRRAALRALASVVVTAPVDKETPR